VIWQRQSEKKKRGKKRRGKNFFFAFSERAKAGGLKGEARKEKVIMGKTTVP